MCIDSRVQCTRMYITHTYPCTYRDRVFIMRCCTLYSCTHTRAHELLVTHVDIHAYIQFGSVILGWLPISCIAVSCAWCVYDRVYDLNFASVSITTQSNSIEKTERASPRIITPNEFRGRRGITQKKKKLFFFLKCRLCRGPVRGCTYVRWGKTADSLQTPWTSPVLCVGRVGNKKKKKKIRIRLERSK